MDRAAVLGCAVTTVEGRMTLDFLHALPDISAESARRWSDDILQEIEEAVADRNRSRQSSGTDSTVS